MSRMSLDKMILTEVVMNIEEATTGRKLLLVHYLVNNWNRVIHSEARSNVLLHRAAAEQHGRGRIFSLRCFS